MKIAVRGGHNEQARGAKGLIDEVVEDRKVKDAVVKYLKQLGHTVLDFTPGKMDNNADLKYGVKKANDWGANLFISIHFNKAYDKYNGALGAEVCVYREFTEAKRVVDGLGNLGFKNRGQKVRTNLYELKNTKMKSMIIETCFVEATKDVELYKKLGPDAIGKKIAESISNKKVSCNNSNSSTTKPPVNTNTNFKVGDRVKITGSKYATGEKISEWAKKQTHTISKIQGDRALLKEITSWCYLKDLQISTSSKKLEVGMYVQMVGSKWATGQSVPSWVKNNKYKVKEIQGDRALLDNVISWAYIKDLKY